MKMKRNKKISAVLSVLTALLMLSISVPAYAAADTPSLDLDEYGSISVTLYSDENECAVTDGELSVYEIADLYLDDGNMAYELTDDFASSGISLDDIEDTALPEEISKYIEANDIDPLETVEVDEDGFLEFLDLAPGLYLVTQSTLSEGYYAIEPFLVTVPQADADGWIYDVDATPKTEVIPDEDDTDDDNGNQSSGSPNSSGNFGNNNSGGSGNSGNSGSSGSSSSDQSKLPKTGQLNWPIPVLAVLGIVFIIAGYVLVRKNIKKEN